MAMHNYNVLFEINGIYYNLYHIAGDMECTINRLAELVRNNELNVLLSNKLDKYLKISPSVTDMDYDFDFMLSTTDTIDEHNIIAQSSFTSTIIYLIKNDIIYIYERLQGKTLFDPYVNFYDTFVPIYEYDCKLHDSFNIELYKINKSRIQKRLKNECYINFTSNDYDFMRLHIKKYFNFILSNYIKDDKELFMKLVNNLSTYVDE